MVSRKKKKKEREKGGMYSINFTMVVIIMIDAFTKSCSTMTQCCNDKYSKKTFQKKIKLLDI